LNRIELQIETRFEAREGQAPLHPHPHLHLPAHGQGQVEMPLGLDRSLDMERVSAFELTRAPSPPLVKFRIDLDNFSIDSRSERSDVELLFFFKLFT
jgi:hypothetical protein